jgi:hypothetical protein
LGGHGIFLYSFINGRIETIFYETLVLEWFRGPQGGKTPSGGFISTPFGFPISFLTPKG